MARLVIFGTGDIARLAHVYFSRDSDHEVAGFTVDRESFPKGVKETHVSLFDGTNCGLRLDGKPVFSVQYHPEASPGPMDSHYLFDRFSNAAKNYAG